jgi:hypothetical protein
MIKSIYANGPFLTISGGMPSSTYIGHNTGPGVGNMRYNPSSQNMEVFDGSTWVTVQSSSAHVSLDNHAISILKWAEQKMLEEAERNKLAETNPAIKDLMNQIKDKEEQINMVKTLITSPGNDTIKPSMVP